MLNIMKVACIWLSLQIALATPQKEHKDHDEVHVDCFNAQIYTVPNVKQLNGTWYIAASAPASRYACVESNVNITDNGAQLEVTLRRADPESLLEKDSKSVKVNITELSNHDGFTMDFGSPISYKILKMTEDALFLCGYISDALSEPKDYGFIMTRNRILEKDHLNHLKESAQTTATSFQDLTDIQQSDKCFTSGSAAIVPSLMMVVYLAMTKVLS